MINVGANIAVQPNAVTPFNPIGKLAVGLERADTKGQLLAPVEEPFRSPDSTNRESSRVGDRTEQNDQQEQQQRKQELQQQQQDQEIIRELAARDREVRAHEAAHAAVGGKYTGSPTYTYQRGPDGVNYAVGGEVSISSPPSNGDPRQALAAAQQIRRAALAPAQPSAQDRVIAAQATQAEIQARADIAEQIRAERSEQEASRTELREEGNQETEGQAVQDAGVAEDIDNVTESSQEREQLLLLINGATDRASRLNDQLSTPANVDLQGRIGGGLDALA